MVTNYFLNFSIRELFTNNSQSEIVECIQSRYIDSLLVLLIFLDNFREDINIPIRITSAYRSPEHNKKVGGVSTSQHLIGQAIDFTCIDFDFESFCCFFRDFVKKSALSNYLGQVIIYKQKKIIHIGLRTNSYKNLTIYEKRNY